MGLHTDIQWCDSTVNPTENCDGCELWAPAKGIKICYAGRLTERFRGRGAFDQPLKLFPGRMAQAAQWGDLRGKAREGKPWIPADLPRLIFISDMSDALCSSVPAEYLRNEIIRVVNGAAGRRHIWIWCTKRPRRMALLSASLSHYGLTWPPNLWVLTSVTDERTANARIPFLLEVGDSQTVRGISAEPLLQTIAPWFYRCAKCGRLLRPDAAEPTCEHCPKPHSCQYALDWVIIGGQSGSEAPRGTCYRIAFLANETAAARCPVFVKQLGKNRELSDPKGGDPAEWPDRLQLRHLRQFPIPKGAL